MSNTSMVTRSKEDPNGQVHSARRGCICRYQNVLGGNLGLYNGHWLLRSRNTQAPGKINFSEVSTYANENWLLSQTNLCRLRTGDPLIVDRSDALLKRG
jgi:hypothetical protein